MEMFYLSPYVLYIIVLVYLDSNSLGNKSYLTCKFYNTVLIMYCKDVTCQRIKQTPFCVGKPHVDANSAKKFKN